MTGIAEKGPPWQVTTGIVGALNREWRYLVGDAGRGYAARVASWSERHPELQSCHSLADVLCHIRDESDNALAALIAVMRSGDDLAGRVILQSQIGRLVGMAQRDVCTGVDDYVAALWCEIRTYPLERRPRRIAANLALDTLKAVRRERRWLVRGEVTTWPPGDLLAGLVESTRRAEAVPDLPGVIELLEAAERCDVIDGAARGLLVSVYVHGLSSRQAAQVYQTSPGSIRIRCNRAVERLRSSAPSLAEAA
jgi:DNA-directed RNA polymerase specialized sigma24 family protein